MKKSIFKGKSTRTKIFTAITALSIALLLCLNLFVSYVFSQNLIMVDLTPEGFYTISDKMEQTLSSLLDKRDSEGNKKQIKITFCCKPDYLTGSDYLRATYFMALDIQKKYDNVKVETVDVLRNPTAVSEYKTTSKQTIKTTDMIVSYGAKYQIVDITTFWTENNFSYNGEYRMASILTSLTAIDQPSVYFLVGHGESYYIATEPESETNNTSYSTLYDLLCERGFKVKTLKLFDGESGERAVPDDCALLIVNNPRTDLVSFSSEYDRFDYISEAEILDRYLVDRAGAMIVNKGYDAELPILESLMSEWGIGFSDSLVKDVDNCIEGSGDFGTTIPAVYDTDEESLGSAYYGEYSALSSAPKVVFNNSGYIYNTFKVTEGNAESGVYNTTRIYNHFLGTSDTARAYNYLSGALSAGEGRKSLAVICAREYLDSITSEKTFSYIFCTNSKDFFSNETLGNSSYANYDVMSTVINNISRTERFASIELGGTSYNSPSYGGKQSVSTVLSNTDKNVYSWDAKEIVAVNKAFTATNLTVYTIIVFILPVLALGMGVAVYIRRKFL